MQQLKPVDVVIAGGGFVGFTLAMEITARTSLAIELDAGSEAPILLAKAA
jgi:hypothetical protein